MQRSQGTPSSADVDSPPRSQSETGGTHPPALMQGRFVLKPSLSTTSARNSTGNVWQKEKVARSTRYF
jgi:hypothetical protein